MIMMGDKVPKSSTLASPLKAQEVHFHFNYPRVNSSTWVDASRKALSRNGSIMHQATRSGTL